MSIFRATIRYPITDLGYRFRWQNLLHVPQPDQVPRKGILVFSARCILGDCHEIKNPTGYLTFVTPHKDFLIHKGTFATQRESWVDTASLLDALSKAIDKNAAQLCRYHTPKS